MFWLISAPLRHCGEHIEIENRYHQYIWMELSSKYKHNLFTWIRSRENRVKNVWKTFKNWRQVLSLYFYRTSIQINILCKQCVMWQKCEIIKKHREFSLNNNNYYLYIRVWFGSFNYTRFSKFLNRVEVYKTVSKIIFF